jgi:transposase
MELNQKSHSGGKELMVNLIMYKKVKKFKSSGLTISEIVKATGLDWKTVRKYSKMSQKEYERYILKASQRNKRFSSYEKEIISIYNANAGKKISKAAVYDFLEEKHGELPGTERTFRNFVDYLLDTGKINPESNKRHYLPVPEIPPGKQMQLDFGEKKQSNGIKLYIFACLLSCCRAKFYRIQNRPFTTEDVIKNLLNSFRFFGGVPQEIAIDQDRLLMVSENSGELVLTEQFRCFTDEQKLRIWACRKADPESKGKVENIVKYVKNNFLAFREYACMEKANEDLTLWMKRRANGKISQATFRTPLSDLEEEKKYLRQYTGSVYDSEDDFYEIRKVDRLSLVSYLSCKYMMPEEYIRKQVGVKEIQNTLRFFDLKTGRIVAVYNKSLIRGSVNTDRGRYLKKSNKVRELRKEMREMFPYIEWKTFVDANYEKYKRYYRDQIKSSKKLLKENLDRTILEKSLRYCLQNKTLTFTDLLDTYRYMEKESMYIPDVLPIPIKTRDTSCSYAAMDVRKRGLSGYDELIRQGGQR